MKYKRVLLKIGGETFGENDGRGISLPSYLETAKIIAEIKKKNDIDLCLVLGSGNIWRGRHAGEENFDMAVAHQMGMVATVLNGLALQEALEELGVPARVMSAIKMEAVCEPFLRRKALHHLSKGRIVIFVGGTGNPFFTTDTAAALRACEVNCDLILKATNVDGVYDKDPNKNPDAKLYKNVSFSEAIEKGLSVMDATAFALCKENKKPIVVFNVKDLKDVSKVLKGGEMGTLVSE